MKKTLKDGNPDGEMREKLEIMVAVAEAAGKVAAFVGRRPSAKSFQALKVELQVLVSDNTYPTENVCRQFT